MTPRLLFSSAGIALLAALPLQSASLLSDNISRHGSASYPGDTSKTTASGRIETGATYAYATEDDANTGIGNTDPDIVKMDHRQERLVDGYNERVGNTAIFGTWQGQHGVTVIFDLQKTHAVTRVSASVREDSNRGTATFQAYVSADGIDYAPLGVWDGAKTTLDTAEADAGRNTEIAIDAPSPATARYVKLYLSHWNEDHSARKYRQLVIGEIAIWGDPR